MSRFNIQNKCETIVAYVLEITVKSPKKLRCDIIPNTRNITFAILENIIRANQTELNDLTTRKAYQQEAMIDIRILEAYSEICMKNSFITKHQFEVLTRQTCELYDMLEKWKVSDSKRI